MGKVNDSNKHLVFIFSKDRPDRLNTTLPKVQSTIYPVILLDDSCVTANKIQIREACNKFNIHYHGVAEQKQLIEKINIPYVDCFISQLGKSGWSLGYNRNYALIYGSLLGAEKILFMDDDIVVENPKQIEDVFKNLNEYQFIGTKISLMPDDSILGHIYSTGGESLPRYTSGGFLGINTKNIRHYFLNTYNEDCIWLFLENHGAYIKTIGSVTQLVFDPFLDWRAKLIFQEFGEVLWTGILHSLPTLHKQALLDSNFWEQVFEIRVNEIKHISKLSLNNSFKGMAFQIRDMLLAYHQILSSNEFTEQFKNYFEHLDRWRSILHLLKR